MANWARRKWLMLVFLFVAGAFIVLALPLVTGSVTPESLYGVRLPLATNDPSLWYEVNQLAGWWMVGLGVLTGALALVLYGRRITDQQYGFRVAFPLLAGVLLGLVLLRVTYLR
ncbi:MAG: SdpI family protein [Anaerolineae bacterium]